MTINLDALFCVQRQKKANGRLFYQIIFFAILEVFYFSNSENET